jgi:altronate dehydratase
MTHVPALVISPRDNVATALEPLAEGQTLIIAGQSITIAEATPRGHKIALRPIRRGDEVYKYGSTIGTATCDIQPGSHVHTHNVVSRRGRAPQNSTEEPGPQTNTEQHRPQKNTEQHRSVGSNIISPDGPRLAEPPDRSPVTGRTTE